MGPHPRRVVRGFAAALVVLSLAAVPVAADTVPAENFSFSQSGLTAEAHVSDCADNGDGTTTCSGGAIFLFAGKTRTKGDGANRVTEVCADIYTDTFNSTTGEPIDFTQEFGCTTELGAGSVIAKDLSTATLTATTVAIQGQTCDEFECQPTGDPRDVVVEGTWTAVTPVVRELFRGFRDDGVCVQRDRFSGSYRDASFAGTFDGQPFEAEFAVIRDGKSSFSVTCTI